MARNHTLLRANKDKQDEFYTAYKDIEDEMPFYEKHFIQKVIYCNCDDAKQSNFFKYFVNNFHQLRLKCLVASCFKPQFTSLFDTTPHEKAYKATFMGNLLSDGTPEIITQDLKSDGDFRSKECVELLKQADIVITNPPFSLFREFVTQLARHKKQFLILGNMNAITCKICFELLMRKRIKLGRNAGTGNYEFQVPEDYVLRSPTQRIDEKGTKYLTVNGIRWFTNLDYEDHRPFLELTAKYTPDKYPKYDNYDAINISNVCDIPCDYYDAMGVPISFLDKHNPNQFEILGINKTTWHNPYRGDALTLNGEPLYARILIRRIRAN